MGAAVRRTLRQRWTGIIRGEYRVSYATDGVLTEGNLYRLKAYQEKKSNA